MPIEGYIRKKPDSNWWMEQIHAGEEFRKKHAYQDRWKTWRDYYRGNWNRDVMPVNLFFSLLRSTVPRIYFRNPTISIAPAKPGLLNMAFARVLERADNKLIKRMKMKQNMKTITQDTFMFGSAFGKIGFGGFHSPTALTGEEDETLGSQGERVEYADFTEPNMPWFARVHPKNLVLPSGLGEFQHARWIGEYVTRPIEDVRADPRLENTKGLKVSRQIESEFGNVRRPIKMVEMYEIRDWKTQSVMVIAPHAEEGSKVLYFGPDRLQLYGGMPYFMSVFNEDDEFAWGLPDSKIIEPLQLELNENRTQIMRHRRVALVKLLAKVKSIDESDVQKMVNDEVLPVIFTKEDPNKSVLALQASGIPPELFANEELTMQEMRETLGFSRNQFGEFNSQSGDTTATEAQIVRQAAEIRIDERRDMLADMVVDIVERMHGIIFDNWEADQVIDVVGPGGLPVWVNFRGDLLKTGRYSVKVDPDSSVPETRAIREQRAAQLYTLLSQNPLIDPFKLTQYLLHELGGVQFDDMMVMLPPPQGGPGEGGGPVGPEGLAGMIGNSLSQVAQPGGTKLLTPPKQAA